MVKYLVVIEYPPTRLYTPAPKSYCIQLPLDGDGAAYIEPSDVTLALSNAFQAGRLLSNKSLAEATPLDVALVIIGIARKTCAAGVTAADVAANAPVPTPFTAATRKVYDVPFARELTVALVAVDADLLNVVHDDPELLEY